MASLTSLAILLILGVAISKTYADEPEAIVGGSYAAPGEFKYQVSLRKNGRHFCGGTLISSRHIVTAAHCVHRIVVPPYQGITVVTGALSISTGGQNHTVKAAYYHTRYLREGVTSLLNDIAVIILNDDVVPNNYQGWISLARTDPPKTSALTLSGWGKVDVNGELSTHLKKATVHLVENSRCQYYHSARIYDAQICAVGGPGTGACEGDSGSPLVYRNQLVGIVSWAELCALGSPDIYTRVTAHLDFIREILYLSL